MARRTDPLERRTLLCAPFVNHPRHKFARLPVFPFRNWAWNGVPLLVTSAGTGPGKASSCFRWRRKLGALAAPVTGTTKHPPCPMAQAGPASDHHSSSTCFGGPASSHIIKAASRVLCGAAPVWHCLGAPPWGNRWTYGLCRTMVGEGLWHRLPQTGSTA